MFRASVFWTALGASVVVAQGCGGSSPGPGDPVANRAGAPSPAGAGASGTVLASPAPVSGSAAGGGGQLAQPAAAGKVAAGVAGVGAAAAGMVAAGVAGGTAAGSSGASGEAQRIPCDVEAVVSRSCRSCHAAHMNLGAPMSLVTWADFQKPAVTDASKKVYELVNVRVQDTARPMPPAMDGKISAADRAVVVSWTMQGAPPLAGSAADCTK
jgi:hypothetical protein